MLPGLEAPTIKMLDVFDFITDRGGDPKKVKESQRRRHAKEEDVDEIIALYEDARKTKYDASQAKQKINAIQKEIGQKKKVRPLCIALRE